MLTIDVEPLISHKPFLSSEFLVIGCRNLGVVGKDVGLDVDRPLRKLQCLARKPLGGFVLDEKRVDRLEIVAIERNGKSGDSSIAGKIAVKNQGELSLCVRNQVIEAPVFDRPEFRESVAPRPDDFGSHRVRATWDWQGQ